MPRKPDEWASGAGKMRLLDGLTLEADAGRTVERWAPEARPFFGDEYTPSKSWRRLFVFFFVFIGFFFALAFC